MKTGRGQRSGGRKIVMVEMINVINWIDINDRLPEENTLVLVWNKDAADIGFIKDWRWRDYSETFRGVTHWMPLPEPPD